MPLYTDQLKRRVEIEGIPKRIISLVPSQTELLHDLGLEDEVIGITKFCVHPERWFRTKERVGGTKQLNVDKIKHLQPDLVIANKEENDQGQVEELAKDLPVWISDINNLDTALTMIGSIGDIVNKADKASLLISDIQSRFLHLESQVSISKWNVCYLIWQKPYMTVGGDTFISDMLSHAGFANIYKDHNRYPEINIEELPAKKCDLLFLSSEPFPFQQKHADELQKLLPHIKIILVDGEIFSWYGSRLLKAPSYFSQIQALSVF